MRRRTRIVARGLPGLNRSLAFGAGSRWPEALRFHLLRHPIHGALAVKSPVTEGQEQSVRPAWAQPLPCLWSDPSGLQRVETFWNSFSRGHTTAVLQSVPAFPLTSASVGPRSFGKVRSEPRQAAGKLECTRFPCVHLFPAGLVASCRIACNVLMFHDGFPPPEL